MTKLGYEDGLAGKTLRAEAESRQLKEIVKTLPLRVLSPADWQHWTTSGFVIVKAAVPRENVERLVGLLWEFQEMDPSDPTSWYKPQLRDNQMAELNYSGVVEIYNHQYLWDNRQYPRVYDAFVDIWDREDLWVKIDRANHNPPNRGVRRFEGFIHCDVDTTLEPLPIGVQGVLSLVDTDPEIGGFQCVPELFRTFDAWVKTQPADRNGWAPDTAGFDVIDVPMKSGDLLVFNSLLPHGIRPNRSEGRVRMAQYISMRPAEESHAELREWRIRSWREREAAQGYAFPGDPRNWEKTRYQTAKLSELGEKLLGLRSWYEGRTN